MRVEVEHYSFLFTMRELFIPSTTACQPVMNYQYQIFVKGSWQKIDILISLANFSMYIKIISQPTIGSIIWKHICL